MTLFFLPLLLWELSAVHSMWWRSNPAYAHRLHSIRFCLENLLQRVTEGTGFYAGDTQRWTSKHSGAHCREDRWRGPAHAQGCLEGGRGWNPLPLEEGGCFLISTKEPCVLLAVLDWGADLELINKVSAIIEANSNSFVKGGESRWVCLGKELRRVTQREWHFRRILEKEQEFSRLG